MLSFRSSPALLRLPLDKRGKFLRGAFEAVHDKAVASPTPSSDDHHYIDEEGELSLVVVVVVVVMSLVVAK